MLLARGQQRRANDRARRRGSLRIAIEESYVAAGKAREQRGAKPDRPRSHHQHLVAFRNAAAPDGMRSDGEKLDRRAFVHGQAFGVDKFSAGSDRSSAIPPSRWTPRTEILTQQFRLSGAAGDAVSAGDVRIDDANLAR